MMDRPEFLGSHFHILKHHDELIHTLSCLGKHGAASLVIHAKLAYSALDVSQVTLVLLSFSSDVLLLQLDRPSLLVHHIASILLHFDLAIGVLKLASKALRYFRFLR